MAKPVPRDAPPQFHALMEQCERDVAMSRPVVALIRAGGRIERVLEEAMSSAGLTLPQFNVLMELASSPGGVLPLYELMARLVRSAPNTSAMISRMARDGLVTKTRDTKDQRVMITRITATGWKRLRAAAGLVFAAEKKLLKHVSKTDLKTTARVLEAIARC